MESMIGLLNAAYVILRLKRGPILKLFDLVACVQEKKVKKISDMNIDPFKAVGNGGVTSSSGSSTPTPYLANGENADKSYHSLSNDFSFPPRGISSLYLPAVVLDLKSSCCD
ncbi:hypothetical protein CsSME_00053262 [Camellia sinensis var. sinensis]